MSPSAALPKYIQISEMLIREIAAGHLADGAKLPPEREMARELGIAVGTLRKSLADMQSKGMLARVQGSGNYVRARGDLGSVYAFFRLEKHDGGGLPTAHVLSVDRLPKPANAPDFGPHAEGHRIRRMRYLDSTLIALEEIWLDASYRAVVSIADLSESLYLFYRQSLGLVIASVEDRIGAGHVPVWAPSDFHMKPGDPAGFIERVSWTGEGTAAEYSATWFDTDKARYVSRMGRG